jgi:hypothetical protein
MDWMGAFANRYKCRRRRRSVRQPSAYSFVQTRYFPGQGLQAHIVAGAQNVSLIPVTRQVTRVNPGDVERASGHRVVQLHLNATSDPHLSRARATNNQLTVYRPSSTNRQDSRPATPSHATTPLEPRATRGESPSRARGTIGHLATTPQKLAQPQAHSGHTAPQQGTPERGQRSTRLSGAHQTPSKATSQPQASQQDRPAAPRTNQHSAAARPQPTAPHHQPAPVGTSGHRASKPSAATKPHSTQKNNAGPQNDEHPKDKKKGGL